VDRFHPRPVSPGGRPRCRRPTSRFALERSTTPLPLYPAPRLTGYREGHEADAEPDAVAGAQPRMLWDVLESIPPSWRSVLTEVLADPAVLSLDAYVARERAEHEVYPAAEDVFAALCLTHYASVRAVIIGQDPYHGPCQAHGLAFSVPQGVPLPPSLRNILAELERDVARSMVSSVSLVPWAQHGVLLLNTVLTVRVGEPGSHAHRGWERLTGAIIQAVNAKPGPIVFLLWGARARAQRRSIDGLRHVVIESAHPSPLSARRGLSPFIGSSPFRRANEELTRRGQPIIDWDLGSP
jgi:uracil-DNA glycosylase